MGAIKKVFEHMMPSSSVTTHRLYGDIQEDLRDIKRAVCRNKERESNELYMACMANHINKIHYETFHNYKNVMQNEEIVVVGAGPTLKHYSPIKGAKHIGVNGTYKAIDLDFLFIQDFEGEGNVFSIEAIKDLKCEKFVGHYINRMGNSNMCAAERVADYIGGKNYYVYDYFGNGISYPITPDIECFPLVNNWSSIFSAFQFALFMHPKKIYVVGCDCSYLQGQHFDETKSAPMQLDAVYNNWIIFRDFININYRDVAIVSVNPIGLKGLFEDTYTDSYMASKVLID